MKRTGNLFTRITSFENLLHASKKAQLCKRFKDNVAKFNFNLEKELLKLKNDLSHEIYKPGEYRSFYIYEPKKRLISAAPYRDRVVHHALCSIIEPIFEKSFIFDSYANRKGKGTHKAIERCQEFAKKNKYVLKADIRKLRKRLGNQLKHIDRNEMSRERLLISLESWSAHAAFSDTYRLRLKICKELKNKGIDAQQIVLRGGTFNNNPENSRAANRNRNKPDNSNKNIGFRVSSTLK
jgi:hypothetical protein